jgi:hypothetical protein
MKRVRLRLVEVHEMRDPEPVDLRAVGDVAAVTAPPQSFGRVNSVAILRRLI